MIALHRLLHLRAGPQSSQLTSCCSPSPVVIMASMCITAKPSAQPLRVATRMQPARSVRASATVQGIYQPLTPDPEFVAAVLDAFPDAAVANPEEARVRPSREPSATVWQRPAVLIWEERVLQLSGAIAASQTAHLVGTALDAIRVRLCGPACRLYCSARTLSDIDVGMHMLDMQLQY